MYPSHKKGYTYNPTKVEAKNGPIFKVETDKVLFQKVYKQSEQK